MAMIETRDGTWLYVKDWGAGNPVILIHGWPLSSDSWDPVADALANAGHRVIAYDRRGFGRSEQSWEGYDYDSFADDLADVMEKTGATENVTLVGFSMGGGEVARYMSRHNGAGVVRAAWDAETGAAWARQEERLKVMLQEARVGWDRAMPGHVLGVGISSLHAEGKRQ